MKREKDCPHSGFHVKLILIGITETICVTQVFLNHTDRFKYLNEISF